MLVIDRINKSDLEEYGLLLHELSGKPMNLPAMHTVYNRIQADPNYHIFAARSDDVLAGSIMAIICHDLAAECRPFMVLENLIIRHDMRRKGIGKALLVEAEKLARSLDCFYIIGISGMKRLEAHKLYEAAGFADEPVRGFRKYLDFIP